MIEKSGSVIGIDIGWSETKRKSAICRLDWTETEVSWRIKRFRAVEPERESTIADLLGKWEIAAAAFDGPLRPGFDIIGRYRSAERMLTRRLQPHIGKPGQSSSPVGKLLNEHANICAELTMKHGNIRAASHVAAIDQKALVEAFPSAFMGLMISDPSRLKTVRNRRSDIYYEELAQSGLLRALLKHCLPERRMHEDLNRLENHDDRAALVCAVTALLIAAGSYSAVGDAANGWIILPPRQFIADMQWALLQENARQEREGQLLAVG
ncbi:DUF429 domain-containing protein [Martelella lutilitoris]|uniref:DUF429 domain-containing protein n=1 Tax=Martelella lutilitoris TaxID=2583532 RepID=A0A5C4JUJ6_9HYPH|nr:DUF429 domain-containing protein [Martelella lutilitoris]TNB48841.1 DUF429 domain-containing protein [Martelella lutilitoris]